MDIKFTTILNLNQPNLNKRIYSGSIFCSDLEIGKIMYKEKEVGKIIYVTNLATGDVSVKVQINDEKLRN